MGIAKKTAKKLSHEYPQAPPLSTRRSLAALPMQTESHLHNSPSLIQPRPRHFNNSIPNISRLKHLRMHRHRASHHQAFSSAMPKPHYSCSRSLSGRCQWHGVSGPLLFANANAKLKVSEWNQIYPAGISDLDEMNERKRNTGSSLLNQAGYWGHSTKRSHKSSQPAYGRGFKRDLLFNSS